ncbi:hypothetical protein E3P77_00164 [Wallemia ichthyophaga]|uniref:Pre-mRNA-splicing factor SYF2 n=2 Tax=Wallemia ichthyophaga TaxID=245174 RepID=A0A4T0ID65_WALIC|nr:hypothetical protein E3P90_00163 [Wallemia ichthyophaga]TIB18653.1 hypothetical protein E3P93_00163 [Wallemia ichthyophaga]TIB26293.1 hypothetical protein E3P89_00005 [Wallemia ichthyophaga]TIB27496.1 hypothetical protein E3P88_00163 [Wallemia ichthyophaga]TIB70133.1 hypothetical protein E3P77_00164 [Wallemia ichthyophaga]
MSNDRENKLQELRQRMQKSSTDNRAAVHDEHNTSKNQVRVAHKLEKKEKLADAIQEKKRVVEEGEDVERSKNMDYSIEDNENWEKKLKQKARNARFEFDDAEQVSQRRYKKDLAYIKPNMATYNKQKEQALGLPPGTITDDSSNADKSSTVDLYREADSLIYADHKPTDEDLDKLTNKVNDDIHRRKNFSRKRPEKEEDKTYINDRNKVFNNKINRYFNQYTKEIRESFERVNMSSAQEKAHNAAKEKAHFQSILNVLDIYQIASLGQIKNKLSVFHSLADDHKELLNQIGFKSRLGKIETAINANSLVVSAIRSQGDGLLEDMEQEEQAREMEKLGTCDGGQHDHSGHSGHSGDFEHSHSHSHSHEVPLSPASSSIHPEKPTPTQMEKLLSTLKQFVRDWSSDGEKERSSSYGPILDTLEKKFGNLSKEQRLQTKILVPGAGLARLAFDIARMGFSSQGNEFSYFMLLASFFILNRTTERNEHTLFPFAHSSSNHPSAASQLRCITVPDVLPLDYLRGPESDFSLVAGEFLEIYGGDDEKEQWDVVVTCFYLDTAKNIIDYIKTISHVLRPGGQFINLGPLLYHFESNEDGEPSIELTLEELKALLPKCGFRLDEERMIDTTYTNNPNSMLQYTYKACFWTATKL